jgi:hypothetical protein
VSSFSLFNLFIINKNTFHNFHISNYFQFQIWYFYDLLIKINFLDVIDQEIINLDKYKYQIKQSIHISFWYLYLIFNWYFLYSANFSDGSDSTNIWYLFLNVDSFENKQFKWNINILNFAEGIIENTKLENWKADGK